MVDMSRESRNALRRSIGAHELQYRTSWKEDKGKVDGGRKAITESRIRNIPLASSGLA